MKSAKLLQSLELLDIYKIDISDKRTEKRFCDCLTNPKFKINIHNFGNYEYLCGVPYINCNLFSPGECEKCPLYNNSRSFDCPVENINNPDDLDYSDFLLQEATYRLFSALSVVYEKEEQFNKIERIYDVIKK